jgi:transcriptional regulator with XRE-family HTH domain
MANDLHDAQNLAQFIEMLKSEQGDSNATLAAKIGLSSATVHRLLHGGKADDETLDKIADYAGVTRDWLYALAKGTSVRPRMSRPVSLLVALLEDAPPDIQEDVLTIARALKERRKKLGGKVDKENGDFVGS